MARVLDEFGGGALVSGSPVSNGSAAPLAGSAATTADAEFASRIKEAFVREVYQPLFQRAAMAPEDVPPVMAEVRKLLDVLQQAIAPFDAAADPVPGAGPTQPLPPSAPAQVAAVPDAGRNQRSKVREMVLLDILEREDRACTLQQLMAGLAAKGFADTNAAVVSQLHRLKALGVVSVPGSGIYEITDSGLGHLRKLRSSFGALVPR